MFSAGVVGVRARGLGTGVFGARLVDARLLGAGAGVMANSAPADACAVFMGNKTRAAAGREGGPRPEYCS